MNEGIELHDSELCAISVEDGTAIVHFSPAIIYRPSEIYGPAGSSIWLQPAKFTFHDASATVWTANPPMWVSKGALRIGNTTYHNLIPLNGIFEGSIELSMTLSTVENLAVRGQGVTIQLLGEPTYLEEFLPERTDK